MTEAKILQKEFNKSADAQRFWNRVNNPFLRYKEEKIASLIIENMPANGKVFLEIGCGEGSNLFFLQKRLPGVRLIGIDFSEEKVRFLNARFSKTIGMCADATELPFKQSTFDMVLCRDILHHINWARDKVMAEVLTVLKPGGIVLIFESNGKTALNRIYQFLYPAERGMKDSTLKTLLPFGNKHGSAKIECVEASFLIRAFAFSFGWPEGLRRYFICSLYAIAFIWEKLFECFAPKCLWAYLMMTVRRS